MSHLFVLVYTRPWQRLFRKKYFIRCWACDLKVETPDLKIPLEVAITACPRSDLIWRSEYEYN